MEGSEELFLALATSSVFAFHHWPSVSSKSPKPAWLWPVTQAGRRWFGKGLRCRQTRSIEVMLIFDRRLRRSTSSSARGSSSKGSIPHSPVTTSRRARSSTLRRGAVGLAERSVFCDTRNFGLGFQACAKTGMHSRSWQVDRLLLPLVKSSTFSEPELNWQKELAVWERSRLQGVNDQIF